MIKVLGARCVVKEEKREEKTLSGIVLTTSSAQEPTYKGEVIAVGDGAILSDGTKVPMQVNVGDIVVYAPFCGSPIEDKDQTYIILNERDILCVLEEDNKEGK